MATPSTPNPPHILTALQTGLTYDVEGLSPISQKNAQAGLCDDKASMVRCFERNDIYHFELQERVQVTIGSSNSPPTCSICPVDDGRACRHVWWVDDQILGATARQDARRLQLQVSRNGLAFRKNKTDTNAWTFYDLLTENDLDEIAKNRGWWVQDPQDQEDVDEVEQTAVEILSAFEPVGLLPKQHDQEHFNRLQEQSQALFAGYRAAFIKQVKFQPSLLIDLQAAVPEDKRELLCLVKAYSRLERIFMDFKYWVMTQEPDNGNLENTASSLDKEVGLLRQFVETQEPDVPLQRRVIGILFYALEQVIAHAGDVYRYTEVRQPQYVSMDMKSRDLLYQMVCNPQREDFMLDALRLLDPVVLHDQRVKDKVAELANLLRNTPATEQYTQMLEGIVGIGARSA